MCVLVCLLVVCAFISGIVFFLLMRLFHYILQINSQQMRDFIAQLQLTYSSPVMQVCNSVFVRVLYRGMFVKYSRVIVVMTTPPLLLFHFLVRLLLLLFCKGLFMCFYFIAIY